MGIYTHTDTCTGTDTYTYTCKGTYTYTHKRPKGL